MRLTLIEQIERDLPETVTGREWTESAIIIKALVNRLGGRVTLNLSELKEEGGLILDKKRTGVVYIETDEYDKEEY
jgi:hypothetical protein